MTFRFGTLCSGIEAASEAFLPLGAECAYVSEIEPYPCGVLADRHGAGKPMRMPAPDEATDLKTKRARAAAIRIIDRFARWANRLPNFGDLTQIDPEELPAVDLLVAGFPCQDFSIAGLRQSLAGRRGNLTLYGVGLIHELVRLRRIRSVLLEQVPDILNTKDNAFGALLGGLVGHDAAIASPLKGGRWTNVGVAVGPLGTAAWRVEDAQYSGVAQRRERLFLVASFGDGPDPVEVLFERQGLSRHPPARGEAGEGVARPLAAGSASSGGYRNDADTAENLIPLAFGGNNTSGPIDLATARTASHTASGRQDFEIETFVVEPTTHVLRGHSDYGQGLPNLRVRGGDAGGGSEALITSPVTYSIMPQNSGKDYKARVVDVAQPLMASGPVGGDQCSDYVVQPVCFNARQDPITYDDVSGPLDTDGGTHAIAFSCKDHGSDAGDIAPTMRAMGHGASHANAGGQIAVAFSLRGREGGAMPEVEEGDVSPALRSAEGGSTRPFVAFTQNSRSEVREIDGDGQIVGALAADAGAQQQNYIAAGPDMAVRRITCIEAEKLQGFRPGYTLIEWPTGNRKGDDLAETVAYLISHGYSPAEAEILAQTPDGPRYKALGNSKAVPLVRKIGAAYAAALERYLATKETT